MQDNYKKLLSAGFTILRTGETNAPVIKKCTIRPLGNYSWVTMEKFPTKAARERRLIELQADAKVIIDEFIPREPCWDDERNGVIIPELGIILDSKNLDGGTRHTWNEAMLIAKNSGKRLFTRDEAYVLMYHRDKINSILKEHNGDLLNDYFWSSLEYNEGIAWYVFFGSGYFYGNNKSYTLIVRAVAALYNF